MVYCLAGGYRSDVLTAHMGTVSLCDALRTLSAEFAPTESREHIAHFLELFERLRAYRNHYVHAIRILGGSEIEPIGLAETISAKGRLMLHQETVTLDDLLSLSANLAQARSYASSIIFRLWRAGKDPDAALQSPWPQKPPLLDKLQKPAKPLLD
jgi:hypothetical protein